MMIVTAENFVRAETDTYLARLLHRGVMGVIQHGRAPANPDMQNVVRMNVDTLYSGAVVDLTNDVTVSLPDAGRRYLSMQVINQDHYTNVVTKEAGEHVLTQEHVGTRYAYVLFRTLIDMNNKEDVSLAHKLQDQISVKAEEAGDFIVPDWDRRSLAGVRKVLKAQQEEIEGGASDYFGSKEEVDPVRHRIATAVGWGGLPKKYAMYSSVTVPCNDGLTSYTLTIKDVPVDGFWSITIYNEDGFLEKNDECRYTLNDQSVELNDEGSVDVYFGVDAKKTNFLPIMAGWNYTVRMYDARKEALDGTWVFPKPERIV